MPPCRSYPTRPGIEAAINLHLLYQTAPDRGDERTSLIVPERIAKSEQPSGGKTCGRRAVCRSNGGDDQGGKLWLAVNVGDNIDPIEMPQAAVG